MHPAAPSVKEASRNLPSVKTGEPPADDDIVTSVAYVPNDDAEPVSPELALVDPTLAERLRAELGEAPQPERAVATPAEPVAESAPISDAVPAEPAPGPAAAVAPMDDDPVETASPSLHSDPEDARPADEPEPRSASVHVLRPEPAVEEPEEVVLPAVVPEPAPEREPEPAPEAESEPEPVVQPTTASPASGTRGRASVSPLRRRSRFWHLLVLLATAVLFAGVVAVGVVVVSELTDGGTGSNVTASEDAAAPVAPEAGTEAQEPGATAAPTGDGAASATPRRFAWAPFDGAVSYRFELFRGDEQVLLATTRNPAYELPTSWRHEGRAERLTPGSYRWYVWPVLASGPADAAIVQARLDVP